MTNSERLRSMTDREIAELIMNNVSCPLCPCWHWCAEIMMILFDAEIYWKNGLQRTQMSLTKRTVSKMNELHVCFGVKKSCWNLYDSYGEICVHCGCCSDDPMVRATSRLRVAQQQLQEQLDFNDWDDDPKWKAVQEKNVRSNIQIFPQTD